METLSCVNIFLHFLVYIRPQIQFVGLISEALSKPQANLNIPQIKFLFVVVNLY